MTQVELPFERLSTRTPSARGAARPVEWRSEFSFGRVSVGDGGSIGGDGDGGRGVVTFAQSRLRRRRSVGCGKCSSCGGGREGNAGEGGYGGNGGDIIGGNGRGDGATLALAVAC